MGLRLWRAQVFRPDKNAVQECVGHYYRSSLEPAVALVEGQTAVARAAEMAEYRDMAVVVAAAACIGAMGPGRPTLRAAGVDIGRILGRRRSGAAGEGGIGYGSHRLAAVAGVAIYASQTCPRSSRTWYWCAHLD
jgi:hypothetical protein